MTKRRPVREAAETLLAARLRPSLPAALQRAVHIGEPQSVREYRGAGQFWYVPLVADGREVGFMHLDVAGQLVRYTVSEESALESASSSVAGLPPEDVVRLALEDAGSDARLVGQPELVYLGFPTRMAWACRVAPPDGAEQTVFVTPEYAWLEEETD